MDTSAFHDNIYIVISWLSISFIKVARGYFYLVRSNQLIFWFSIK